MKRYKLLHVKIQNSFYQITQEPSDFAVDLFGVDDIRIRRVRFDALDALLALLFAGVAFAAVGDDVAVPVDESPAPLLCVVGVEFECCCHTSPLHRHDMILPVVVTTDRRPQSALTARDPRRCRPAGA